MPSLLQRQIFKEIANLFVLAVGVLLTLILISRAVQMRELFLGLDLGILDTVLLFGYMTPLFLMLVIPIACMLSVFLTFLRMSTDRELVALRAGGINIYQMLPAPLLFSVICMLLTLWVSLHWLAWGMGHFRETILEIANTRARVAAAYATRARSPICSPPGAWSPTRPTATRWKHSGASRRIPCPPMWGITPSRCSRPSARPT